MLYGCVTRALLYALSMAAPLLLPEISAQVFHKGGSSVLAPLPMPLPTWTLILFWFLPMDSVPTSLSRYPGMLAARGWSRACHSTFSSWLHVHCSSLLWFLPHFPPVSAGHALAHAL